ncbi:Tim44 domain-containing protein [Mesorhizobium sp. 1M-11]|uniref:Tim44 domain-containing protein n=1 Tax=Mesorhizobium sp. 1M-11 TaxID=1529006 RepID=UPI0006C76D91|nr:Tim44 domain-containing protein [Mesorhizobium sp. 1M-11]
MISGKTRSFALLATLLMAFTLVSTDFADARRGGSFGSRGTRTFQSAPPTRTAPNTTAPVERSMTPNTGPTATTRQQQPNMAQQRPGLFGGFGGLMRGILIGGLLGALLGYGFGGMAGALGFIVQLLLVGLVVMLALRFFRSRQTPATATASGPAASGPDGREMFGRMANRDAAEDERPAGNGRAGSFSIPGFGTQSAPASQDIELEKDDLDRFERMLDEVQTAFAKEDHAGLRRLTTPEMVSYFSEELAENAQNGVRNDVADVHLVQADIAEAWREDNQDYATAAFRYESVDVMRDRKTGKIVEGDEELTETTELWTFTRPRGGDWKLSAIQEATA